MDKIGIRIKNRRKSRKITLTDLAARVGVTASCLSQIESCKSFPSILTLKKIAVELGTTVGELIGENEKLDTHPVIKKEERKLVNVTENGTELHLMSNYSESKSLETFFVILQKNGDSTEVMTPHTGEEFCYIISGEVELVLSGQHYNMTKGDCAYYDSIAEHMIKNRGDDIARILWVVTPPHI